MVRRGSTVRVRQRALQNPRTRGFFVQDDLLFVARAVGMEPFMELSSKRGRAELSARPLVVAQLRQVPLCFFALHSSQSFPSRAGSTSNRRPGSGTSSSSGTSGRCSEHRARGRRGSSPAPAVRPPAGRALRERRRGDASRCVAAVRVAEQARSRPTDPCRRLPRSRHVIPPVRPAPMPAFPPPIQRASPFLTPTPTAGDERLAARCVQDDREVV